jgi:hypothetical protein
MVAATMSPELHDRGNHAVMNARGRAAREVPAVTRANLLRTRTSTQGQSPRCGLAMINLN